MTFYSSLRTSPVDLPEVQDDSAVGLGAGLQGDREKDNNNKALVHEGSLPLVQIFFSDVSKITVFQSLNPSSQKSNDECFKIAKRNSLCRSKKQT